MPPQQGLLNVPRPDERLGLLGVLQRDVYEALKRANLWADRELTGLLGPAAAPVAGLTRFAGEMLPSADIRDIVQGSQQMGRGDILGGATQSLGGAAGAFLPGSFSGLDELIAAAILPTMKGPRLTETEFNDLLRNSKQRKSLSPERKQKIAKNKAEVSEVRDARAKLAFLVDPLARGKLGLEFRLAEKKAAQQRQKIADEFGVDVSDIPTFKRSESDMRSAAISASIKKSRVNKARQIASLGIWRKDFSDVIMKTIEGGGDVDGLATRANLEAVDRILRKDGWSIRHRSEGNSGRRTSRYLVSPDGKFEVRVSDHFLPQNPQRDFNQSQFGTRWNHEVILGDTDDPRDLIADIKDAWKEAAEN